MIEAFDLAFRSAYGAPVASGLIRSKPEDFRVNEVLGFEPDGEGEHAYLWLEKNSANTGWVADQLSEWLELRHFDVSYAGKKDRHAITRQWFSCWLPGKVDPDWQAFQCEGVKILDCRRHIRKLRRGDNSGNHFCLTIRDFEFDQNFIERLEAIREKGFPNYFGLQRFGIEAQNLHQAERLFCFLADFETRPSDKVLAKANFNKKKRDMVISAARSLIFNRVLSERLAQNESLLEQMAWLYGSAPHRDITIAPLEGELTHWGRGLRLLEVKAMKRPLWVIPEDMSWEIIEGKLILRFQLPSGVYATSFLDAVMTIKDARRFAYNK